MLAVETNKLTKRFNSFSAVDGLDLRVPEGSIYGFLGPNGAGKTTTIKMLLGLSKPTSGDIKLYGRDVTFGSLKNRMDIGFLPDVPSFYDWMKPKEFLYFCGNLFSIDKKVLNDRVDNLIELVGLEEVNKKIKGFSRGMKQRLGIAQALINDPKVIFLDEPTSALDPIGRKDVMDIIGKLAGRVTVFFSTHILSDVERICDRVVILDKGKMLIEDTIPNLRQKYSRQGIEIEADESENFNEFLSLLSKQKWVDSTEIPERGKVKVLVNNLSDAQINMTALLTEKKVRLKKFMILEPSLEDIFLKVVSKS
ncbi:ABC transporter ATP-binding protein [Acetivibrio cellulolyticus]|uniref:ABC transporter ATP-binding protein n=1 Tax=Acetivibrio cellulolyticus TaxID=35830 RepID=UPI0001E2EB72|nr:ABC transporter ATP-binding protein [Acetivibrio cellulolyticus]